MKLRRFSAALVMVMILSLLGGCGGSGSSDDVSADMKERYSQYVALGEYKGVEYTPSNTEVTDDDIQSKIDSLISTNTEEIDSTEGIATYGDTVNIDYVGYVDGVAFDGGDTGGSGTNLELGSGTYIDGFEDQIVGHSPGDSFLVEVTFPEDYGVDELNGQHADFETTLNYIVTYEVPEYTDEFVASVTDYSTTDEYEAAVRADLEESYAESDLETDKAAVLQTVIDTSAVTEYPQQELEERITAMVENVTEIAESYDVDVETLLSYYGYDSDTFMDQVESSVTTYINERMIIVAIADKEGITVTEQELEDKINEMLELTGLSDKDTLSETYGYTGDEDYCYEVLYDKIQELVYENAVAVDESGETIATETEAEETTAE